MDLITPFQGFRVRAALSGSDAADKIAETACDRKVPCYSGCASGKTTGGRSRSGRDEGGAAAGHVMGTTRMGHDPKKSVVNDYGQAHDVPNLFIGGSSVYVTSTGVNPTLTIFALAYRTSEQIVKLWKQGAF